MTTAGRHNDPTLLALDELSATLNDAATPPQAAAWWPLVLKVAASVEGGSRTTQAEREAVRRIRTQVSEIYGARNRGLPSSYSSAIVAVQSLRGLLEARTTGFDGHRLR